MKKIVASLGLIIFIAGIVIAPAIHNIHSDNCTHGSTSSHTKSHNPETCEICLLATMVIITACTYIATWLCRYKSNCIISPDTILSELFIPNHHPARAPPAA